MDSLEMLGKCHGHVIKKTEKRPKNDFEKKLCT